MFKHDPYNKFRNDKDRRIALMVKEIRLAIVGVSLSTALVLTGSNLSPTVIRWLRTFL